MPAFKLDTIIKHATLFPGGFYSVTFAFIMNEDKWNKVPRADQDLIMSVSGEDLSRVAGRAWDKADRSAEEQLKKAGVVMAEASPALIKEVQSKAETLEQEWIKSVAAKGVDGAKVLAEFRAELKNVATGK